MVHRPVVARSVVASALDTALELTIIGSFSRAGFVLRRTTQHWAEAPRLEGRTVVVTGASSGIGRAAALGLARLGAEVWVIGRDVERCAAVVGEIEASGGRAEAAPFDVTDPDAVEWFVSRYAATRDRLHGLVHSAGALLARYERTADGVEMTVATHVLAPYRLTWLLAPYLRAAGDAAIVTVSSGGMYTERFDVTDLEMSPDVYNGVRAYARAKRAQVVLAREWARRWHLDGVASHAMHPGWVDTPGLTAGLPTFARLGPVLRRPEEGADTVVWLAAGGAQTDDGFWHDRRLRREHYVPWTRPRQPPDTEARRLWSWCAQHTGLGTSEIDASRPGVPS